MKMRRDPPGGERARVWAGGIVMAGLALGCVSGATPPESVLRLQAQDSLMTARTASERRDWKAAGRAYGRAALALAAIDDGLAEAPLRRDEAEALRRAGEPAAAATADERALMLDRALGRAQDEAADLAGLARSAAAQGHTARAVEIAEQALPLAGAGTRLEAVVENDLALYLLENGEATDRARAETLLASALASNQARNDALGIATSELNLGRAALAAGDLDPAAASLQRALASFRALENPEGLANAHELLARVDLARDQKEAARFHLAQAREGFEFLKDRAGFTRVNILLQKAESP